MLLEIGAALAALHFGAPLLYYWRAKRWLRRPWGITPDPTYRPRVTVIIPTYNEAPLVEEKLDNIYEQDYPRDRLEVVVVDSASTDGTPNTVKKWAKAHPDLTLILVEEAERRGKAHALNTALRHATGEVVVITDADAHWPTRDTLTNTVKWLADPTVGAVSCIKKPANTRGVEDSYRDFYNTLRVAESKAWATPIFHGELAAFKKELLERLGGFPTDIGADDSHTATKIAMMGYRTITPQDVTCIEAVPKKDYHTWRMRRAQHLVQHFAKALREGGRTPRPFKRILHTEAFLHLVNPWALLATAILLTASAALGSTVAIALLALGAVLLPYKPYRTWAAMQVYLIAATAKNLWNKELVWEKQVKVEQTSPRIRNAISSP